jgi:hypothetical protein
MSQPQPKNDLEEDAWIFSQVEQEESDGDGNLGPI